MKKGLFHRILILFIILIIPVFVLKEYKVIKASKEGPFVSNKTKNANDNLKKSFVIISYGKNNANYIEKHFDSILNQEYDQYRIIYIDDTSTDGSFQKIKRYFSEKKPKQPVKLIRTNSRRTVFDCYCDIVKNCDDNEIILHLEGNDWLLNKNVLSKLNNVYSNKEVWLTYSQYLEYPSYKKGKKDPLPKRALTHQRIQKYPWVTSPLKTYYAKVFKQLYFDDNPLKEKKPHGRQSFLLMEPMVKMAKRHIRYIPEILYVHNRFSSENRLRLGIFEHEFTKNLRKKEKSLETHALEQSADIVIFAKDISEKLESLIYSIYNYVKGNFQIYLFIESQNRPLKEDLTGKAHIVESKNTTDFKPLLLDTLFDEESPSHFVVFTTEDIEIQNEIPLNECIIALMKTRAYGFYFHLGNTFRDEASTKRRVGEKMYSWLIEESGFSPDSLQWTLYRKREIERDFEEMEFSDKESLVQAWAKLRKDKKVGLFYETPRITSKKL